MAEPNRSKALKRKSTGGTAVRTLISEQLEAMKDGQYRLPLDSWDDRYCQLSICEKMAYRSGLAAWRRREAFIKENNGKTNVDLDGLLKLSPKDRASEEARYLALLQADKADIEQAKTCLRTLHGIDCVILRTKSLIFWVNGTIPDKLGRMA